MNLMKIQNDVMFKSGINTPDEFKKSSLKAKGNETFDDWIKDAQRKKTLW